MTIRRFILESLPNMLVSAKKTRRILVQREAFRKLLMSLFSSEPVEHHAAKGFMHVGNDIFPHHQPVATNRFGQSPMKQFQQFKYTFRESLYTEPHTKPTSLAFSDREVKRRASLLGKVTSKEPFEAPSNRHSNPSNVKDSPNTRRSREKTAQRVLQRQTNVRLYTGIHRHRFDHVTGNGKGKSGRDSNPKGRGNIPFNASTLSRNFLYYKKHGLPDFQLPPHKKVPNFNSSKIQARNQVMRSVGHLLRDEYDDVYDVDVRL